MRQSTKYKFVPLFKQIRITREFVKAFDDEAVLSMSCIPVMLNLMECMAKNDNNPLSCSEFKLSLANCTSQAAAAKRHKSTLYSDINRFVFSRERRDGKK